MNKTTPHVSIITPAYNAECHIGETIASVKSQTLEDWQLLIVDDCSKDATASIVSDLAAQDRRIHLLRQKENGGPAAARQRALEAARARFIAFLDSDDLWLPEKLMRQLDFMQTRAAAMSFTEYRRISQDGTRIGRQVNVPHRLNYRDLLKNTAITTSTVIVDRDQTGPFSLTRTYYDDYALWLELLRRGHVAHGLQMDLLRYRVVTRSVSRNKSRSAYWVWRTYRDIEKLGWFDSMWCFVNYAVRAVIKYSRF